MKKNYEEPSVEVTYFEMEDVITASGGDVKEGTDDLSLTDW